MFDFFLFSMQFLDNEAREGQQHIGQMKSPPCLASMNERSALQLGTFLTKHPMVKGVDVPSIVNQGFDPAADIPWGDIHVWMSLINVLYKLGFHSKALKLYNACAQILARNTEEVIANEINIHSQASENAQIARRHHLLQSKF
eukprot:JP435950.1.p1 GENE.JP435950.1~~JP435950.1.p1  ORF type:complete len:143 (-),score=23.50 JP435950.1:61-489(-)